MNNLWFALQAFGFAREKGLMNRRVLIALAAYWRSTPIRAAAIIATPDPCLSEPC